MVVGGNQQKEVVQEPFEVVEELIVPEKQHTQDVAVVQESDADNLTQKTASFLEGAVNGLYDVIVSVLSHIASLFF